jgi:hypothetical protein
MNAKQEKPVKQSILASIIAPEQKSTIGIKPTEVPEFPTLRGHIAPKEGVLLLDLMKYKTEPCQNTSVHNMKSCFYYHDGKTNDRRRPLGTYTSSLCSKSRSCPQGDSCPRSHNSAEDFYHPEKYKTKFC